METFPGYRRPDGTVGVRNHVAIIPAVVCANTVVQRIAQLVPGTVALPHPHGCAQIGDDVQMTMWSLAGAAANPNVAAALIVGLGCETCQSTDVLDLAQERTPGKHLERFSIQEAGGSIKAIQRGVETARALVAEVATQQPEPTPLSELIVGTECGGYDATSGAAANPTVGIVADWLVAQGATVLLGETAEFFGAEQTLARRARDKETAQRLYEIVARLEAEAQYVGETVAGAATPTATEDDGSGSRAAAALGCIRKGGTTEVQEVVGFSDRPLAPRAGRDGYAQPRHGGADRDGHRGSTTVYCDDGPRLAGRQRAGPGHQRDRQSTHRRAHGRQYRLVAGRHRRGDGHAGRARSGADRFDGRGGAGRADCR